MTYMIPPVFSEAVSSSGERQVFEILKDDPDTDAWTCLHSLGISKHVETVYGEIDFVLIIPGEGVFCLEVKSGSVSRRDGIWQYRNKYGEAFSDPVGPFRQVSTGMFSLMNSIKEKFGKKHRLSNLLYGWAVIFPQCEFNKTGPDYEPWQVYSLDDRRRPISQFIKTLSQQTHEKMKDQRWYDPDRSRPSKKDISALVDFLRGDFEFCVKKGSAAKGLQDEILQLTSEQTRCLESLRGNRRCFFTGAAGTGKTVLAVELANREALNGNHVLFLCFNRLLAQKLNVELSEFTDRIKADNFHHYVDELVLRSSFKEEFTAEKDKKLGEGKPPKEATQLFNETFPFYAELALAEGREHPFDVLVVDEAQDLIIPKYLDVMDGLVRGGLSSGRWAFFGDLYHQKIFSGLTPDQMNEEIEKRSPYHVKFSLMMNCRNTRNIGKDTCKLAGFEQPPYLNSMVTGPPVDYRYYSAPSEHAQILKHIIGDLSTEGIRRDGITILSRHRLKNSILGAPETKPGFKLCDLAAKDRDPMQDKDKINFCTISSFKGLESPAVIITDIRDLDADQAKDLLYVAMSRAQQRLFMILPETVRHKVNRLLGS